jgi:hypothetical protein
LIFFDFDLLAEKEPNVERSFSKVNCKPSGENYRIFLKKDDIFS